MKVKVTGKTFNHITLAEAKTHARVATAFTADDAYLTSLITVATDMAEKYIQNHIALTDLTGIRKDFSGKEFTVFEGNFKAVTSLTYTDNNGATVTLAAADYEVEAEEFYFRVFLNQAITTKNLTIVFTAGFDATTIIPVIKQAILIKLVDLYDIERASYTSGSFQLNKAYESLLNYHKKIGMF